jgi:MSHA biogenesis protein MshO
MRIPGARSPVAVARREMGFSLVELIMVMVIGGIIVTYFALFSLWPLKGSQDLDRRAALVDAAESALRRMARDIRIALPNSIRITNNPGGVPGFALELIPTVDGGRYCVAGLANCANAFQYLDFAAADSDFDILGCFRDAGFVTAAGAGSGAYRLVINNLGNEVYAAAGSPAVITPSGSVITLSVNPGPGACPGGGSHHIHLGTAHQFSSQSLRQRVFVVPQSGAVTYFCNTTLGTLTRYAGYGVVDPQPVNAGAPPLSSVTGNRVADRLSACSVTSTTDQVRQEGMVTLDLSISSQGETIRLIDQVQLDNSS